MDKANRTRAAHIRPALLEARARLIEGIKDNVIEAPGMMTYGSQAAAASQVFDQQRDLAMREHNEGQVEAIDAALARIDAGTYGTCTQCGKPIGQERLEALPTAAHCIDCQRTVAKRR